MSGRRSLLLVSPYLPPHVGGVEQYVLQLARRLSGELGWRVVIATCGARSRRRTPVREQDGDLTIYRLPVLLEKWSLGFGDCWISTLRSIIERESIDVVNAHAPVPFIADAAARAARRTPFVLTYHAGPMRKGRLAPDALGWAYEHVLLPRTAGRASQVIVSSMFVARELGHALGTDCVAIPPGVDERVFTPGATPAPSDALLYVGSLSSTTPYKNVPLLLRAVRDLRLRYPAISLAIVGDGDMSTAYAEQAEQLEITPHVTFRGRLGGRRAGRRLPARERARAADPVRQRPDRARRGDGLRRPRRLDDGRRDSRSRRERRRGAARARPPTSRVHRRARPRARRSGRARRRSARPDGRASSAR